NTITRNPARARYAAAVRPLWPAPMTMTSWSGLSALNAFHSLGRCAKRTLFHRPLVVVEPQFLVGRVGGAALLVGPAVDAVVKRRVGPRRQRGAGNGLTAEVVLLAMLVFGGDLLAHRQVDAWVIFQHVAAHPLDPSAFVAQQHPCEVMRG